MDVAAITQEDEGVAKPVGASAASTEGILWGDERHGPRLVHLLLQTLVNGGGWPCGCFYTVHQLGSAADSMSGPTTVALVAHFKGVARVQPPVTFTCTVLDVQKIRITIVCHSNQGALQT